MQKVIEVFFYVLLLFVLVLVLMTRLNTLDNEIMTLKQEAVDRGFAEHNATNGVWQWREK